MSSTPIRTVLLLVATALAARAGVAQTTVPVDRIVAVVGNRPFLASEIEEQLITLRSQGQTVPTDSAGLLVFRRQLLGQMIDQELLVQEAERDTSIKVTEQEVQDQVEQSVQNIKKQIPDPAEFQRQLKLSGFTSVDEWRRKLTEEQRRTILASRLLDALKNKGKIHNIPPTEAQMRDFWGQYKGQQPKRPAVASFRQIVVVPAADSVAKLAAYQLAESLLVALRGGADFGALARKFSGDSASAAQGGELGWFRRGVMVKPFEDAAFRLRPGDLSPIVETQYGFHIIQVERVQPAEVLGRHILIVPHLTDAQIAIARQQADSVYQALKAGASFDTLARRYADPDSPKLADAAPITQLDSEYQALFARDTTRGLKTPLMIGPPTRPKFAVIDVTSRQPEGELSFDEVKEQIRAKLSQTLGEQHYVDQLRRATYIDIRL